MTAARWYGAEYQLVNVTDNGEFVLRDDFGDVLLTDGVELDRQTVEIRCEQCGRWSLDAIPVGTRSRWVCADRPCYDTERATAPRYGTPK